jgi:hypothetical protein
MEKLVPQPQEAVALGFTTRNEAPIRSSTKSTSDPARNGTEAESTSTTAPSREITRSSSALAWSTSNLYWKPEQPPPSTLQHGAVAFAFEDFADAAGSPLADGDGSSHRPVSRVLRRVIPNSFGIPRPP